MAGFLRKLFAKDAEYYLEKGESLLAQNRFAEARDNFSQGLEAKQGLTESTKLLLKEKYVVSCNALAEMNIAEGEALLTADPDRAEDHFQLALKLAEDVKLRQKAEQYLASPATKVTEAPRHTSSHSCTGCGAHHGQKTEISMEPDEYLDEDEHFELLIGGLPGDLPRRYRELGKEFAKGYMYAHNGNAAEALKIYERLAVEGENDILFYEQAVLHFQLGNKQKTEDLLRKAIKGSIINPSAVFTFAEFMVQTGRPAEALPPLKEMWDEKVLPEQAALLLGDVHHVLGNIDKSLEWYGPLLQTPLAKEAAKRIVPILQSCQRAEEAAFITKNYLKCC